MTRARPIAPAIRPPRSWSDPSVADTEETSAFSSFSGSAPNLRTFASVLARFWVKLPVISALPPAMPLGSVMVGADWVTPSSTIATALQPSGGPQPAWTVGCFAAFWVSLSQSLPPLCVKVSSTFHSLLCGSTVAAAVLIWEPVTSAGARMYFSPWSLSQLRMKLSVSSRPLVGFGVVAQSSALNAGVTDSMVLPWLPGSAFWSTLPVVLVALGVGVTGFVLGVAVDEGDGEGVAASSPDGTRSPLPDLDADGDGLAVADADGEADADAEPVGAGAGE